VDYREPKVVDFSCSWHHHRESETPPWTKCNAKLRLSFPTRCIILYNLWDVVVKVALFVYRRYNEDHRRAKSSIPVTVKYQFQRKFCVQLHSLWASLNSTEYVALPVMPLLNMSYICSRERTSLHFRTFVYVIKHISMWNWYLESAPVQQSYHFHNKILTWNIYHHIPHVKYWRHFTFVPLKTTSPVEYKDQTENNCIRVALGCYTTLALNSLTVMNWTIVYRTLFASNDL